MDTQSAARQFLRHDRTVGHQEHGDAVGDDADQHQRQDRVVVAGDFKGEDNKRKSGARGRSKHRTHGDKCEGSG